MRNSPSPTDAGSPVRVWLQRFVAASPEELAALLWSFAWFFCVLSSYYMVRPVRETFATVVGNVDRLFFGTFLAMLIAAPVYAAVVDRFDRRKFVPIVYRFFSACLLGFGLVLFFVVEAPQQESTAINASTSAPAESTETEIVTTPTVGNGRPNGIEPRPIDVEFVLGVIFFVWVSVFVLFVVSIFWSVLADIYSSEQATRLFGFIAAGGSIGGMLSSSFLGLFGDQLPTSVLLLLPIGLLELAICCFRRLEKTPVVLRDRVADLEKPKPHTGIWTGILSIAKSPYLLGICLFLLLGKWCATTIYMELIETVQHEVPDLERRTQLFARENLATQVGTLVFQTILTRQILASLKLPATLATLPAMLVVGFGLVATHSSLWLLFTLQIIQRIGAYGVLVPAQEVLFTVLSEDEKYKSKNFIDTAVFRGGDAASASLHKILTDVFTSPVVALLMAPVASVWAVTGWWIGRSQMRRAKSAEASDDTTLN